MMVHNKRGEHLPALKLKIKGEREIIESDSKVKNLIRSKLLLDKGFNTLYMKIFDDSKELLRIINLSKEQAFLEYIKGLLDSSGNKNIMKFAQEFKLLMGSRGEKGSETEEVIKLKRKVYKRFQRKAATLSTKIQNREVKFEDERRVDLLILSSTIAFVCKRCSKIVSLEKFKPGRCSCGESVTQPSDVEQLPVQHFNDNLIKFLEHNFWFEHGVDYILRKKSFNTLVGYNVLGHSGVWHEVDNIADLEKNSVRIFCECKHAEVTVRDIFIFSGKMIDIGCTRGYIFTTSKEVSKDISRLARSRNIDIVTDVLAKDSEALLEEIKER